MMITPVDLLVPNQPSQRSKQGDTSGDAGGKLSGGLLQVSSSVGAEDLKLLTVVEEAVVSRKLLEWDLKKVEQLVGLSVGSWLVTRMYEYSLVKITKLQLFRLLSGVELSGQADDVYALNLWGLMKANFWVLAEPCDAVEAARELLSLMDRYGWEGPLFDVACVLVAAAVEKTGSPISEVASPLFAEYEQQLAGAILAQDPEYAYTARQQLDVWNLRYED
ncbi:hypothetical protein [Corynebacterium cystitidis]|uniref:hypothetical protein n=1 Tax=Corynebacterium cystitidis TaxID=35757 RepID=UPI00211E204C|nr:hypothetical protein [Corynebacterium cystitidis]